MLGWRFHLVGTFNYDRGIMGFVASYVVRYIHALGGLEALESRNRFKMIIIAALSMAGKDHDFIVLSPQSIAMDMKMSITLNWRLCIPTQLAFIELYLS